MIVALVIQQGFFRYRLAKVFENVALDHFKHNSIETSDSARVSEHTSFCQISNIVELSRKDLCIFLNQGHTNPLPQVQW